MSDRLYDHEGDALGKISMSGVVSMLVCIQLTGHRGAVFAVYAACKVSLPCIFMHSGVRINVTSGFL